MQPLVIDPQLAALIPPLTPEERAQLEQNLLAEGCRDPLVVWGDVLIDGHNRYEICTRHQIEFQVIHMQFQARSDVEAWIIRNQLGRRNLNSYQRSVLALKLKPTLASEAQTRIKSGKKPDPTQNFAEGETNALLGTLAKVSRETIRKVAFVEQRGAPEVREQASRGEISIHQAFEASKAAQALQVRNTSESDEWYTPEVYIRAVHKLMGSIDLDPASSAVANQVVKASRYYTLAENGLEQDWTGRVYLNPPYERDGGESGKAVWSARLIEQYEAGITTEAVLLINATPERKWFQPLWNYAICFTDHRIQFYHPDALAPRPTYGNAFVYFGNNEKNFADIFSAFGTVVKRLD